MAGLVPATDAFTLDSKTRIPGTGPGRTNEYNYVHHHSDQRTTCRKRRSETAGDSGLPADQRHPGIRRRKAGADLAQGEARLSDPRRHSHYVAGGSAKAGVIRALGLGTPFRAARRKSSRREG